MNMNDFIEVLQEKKVPYSIAGDKIFVAENLDLCDTNITSLPDNLIAYGWLDLSGTSITRLPDNLSISGGLNLRYTDITRLPNNLSVGGNLDICYTGISSLPDNLKVGRHLHLHPEEITNIAYRKLLRDGDYTVFAAWLNGKYCVVFNEKIYTLAEFFSGAPAADAEQAARECVAELKQRRKTGGCGMNNSPELLQSIQKMHESGLLADYACQVYIIPQEDAELLARFALASLDDGAEIRKPAVIGSAEYYRDVLEEICGYSMALRSGGPEEEDLQGLSDALEEVIDMACDACMDEDSHLKSSGFLMRWQNVSECLPTRDTPVFGGWFSDNGNFVLGCYVRTYSADAGGWVWAVAEDFGKGDWLFGEDNPVEFWMPLPGKPELVGGAA